MTKSWRSLRAGIAATLALSAVLVGTVQPAAAWCRAGVTPWADSTQELRVWNDIPVGWNAAISAARHMWNNIDDDLIYWQPIYNQTAVGTFNLFKRDFSNLGWPDVPAMTTNNLSSQPHTTSDVWANTDFVWNTTGVMSQAQRKTDVRTVLGHEFGHSAGLHHPSVCGAMTPLEIASVMHPNWVKKWATNGDDHAGILNAYPG